MTFAIRILALTLFLFDLSPKARAEAGAPSGIELFADLEKPSLSNPVSQIPELVLVGGGRAAFMVRLPINGELESLQDIKLQDVQKNESGLQLSVYLVGGHRVPKGSYRNKDMGFVEDILIPNELLLKKNFRVPAENLPKKPEFYFELRAPHQKKSGVASLDLQFSYLKKVYHVPLTIRSVSLDLPKRFELKTSFGFSPNAVIQKHGGQWNQHGIATYDEYVELALAHHLDLHKVYLQFPNQVEGGDRPGYTLLKSATATGQSFLELWQKWTLDSREFQFSNTDLPVPEEMKHPASGRDQKKAREYWTGLNESVIRNGLKERTYVYFIDEPTKDQTGPVAENLKLIRGWAPDLRFMITTTYRKAWNDLVQIWCVNLSQWEQPEFFGPEVYQARAKKGDELWFYTSCNAHGCAGPENLHLADLVVDRPTAYARVFPWLAWRYHAAGVLYYDTVYNYGMMGGRAPWRDPFAFTGVGEGSLYYPCTEQLCGLTAVLPSLRMKILELGLEDVEILTQLEKRGRPVRARVEKMIPRVRTFPDDSASYRDLVRAELLDSKL